MILFRSFVRFCLLLLQAIETGDFSAFEDHHIIKEIDTDDNCIDFYCGGTGLGSATSYVGFFYSPDNNMSAVWFAPVSTGSLTPSGNGFMWKEPNGDNRYYVERICGNFFYYEASY